MKIVLDVDDIVRYVSGRVARNPIVAKIHGNNRYSTFEDTIYDWLTSQYIPQDHTYVSLLKAIEQLKNDVSEKLVPKKDIFGKSKFLSLVELNIELNNDC